MEGKALNVERLEKEVTRYCKLMQTLHTTDVSKDRNFQRQYNGYYKMQRRSTEFYQCYYAYLENQKNNFALIYEEVLRYIYEQTGRAEASFASKLLATVNPNMPIIDSQVFMFLGLKLPYYYDRNRIRKIVALYDELVSWYHSKETGVFLESFNKAMPNVEITDTKKIDFILWLTR